MPIYEYACSRCGKVFEEIVIRRSDEGSVSCPACGRREVSRVLSRTAVPRGAGSSGGPPPPCGPVG